MHQRASIGVGLLIGLTIGLVLFFGLYFGLPRDCGDNDVSGSEGQLDTPVTPLYQEYASVAVATDAGPCSVIGKDLLKKGGSVVDAAIGAMLCVGIHNAHSTGIGGGSFMTIYDAPSRESYFINSREVAPLAATENMFKGDSELSTTGASAIAVPGEIAGYWEAHQRFGILPWKELFEPAIKLASDGFQVNSALAKAIKSKSTVDDSDYNLEPIFTNANGSRKIEGDLMTRKQLASTLRQIATEGAMTFYNGTLARRIIEDIQSATGKQPSLITEEDLNKYRVEVKQVINITIGDLTVLAPGPPSGGPVLCFILNILKGYEFNTDSVKGTDAKVLTYHRILEAFKFAYAKRTELGDENFDENITALVENLILDAYAEETRLKINDSTTQDFEYYEPNFDLPPQDSGTSHLTIVGEDGSAVSMTSTINGYFGSSVRGFRTGIIFNNEMDDFSSPNVTNIYGVPPSPTNFIKPGKRPLSSMSPAIVINSKEQTSRAVRILAGASGGTKITTGTALTIINNIWFGKRIDEAVLMKRLHHQLLPDVAQCEVGFEQSVVDGLEKKNHITTFYNPPGSVVQAIERFSNGQLGAMSDERKSGYPDGY